MSLIKEMREAARAELGKKWHDRVKPFLLKMHQKDDESVQFEYAEVAEALGLGAPNGVDEDGDPAFSEEQVSECDEALEYLRRSGYRVSFGFGTVHISWE